MSNNELIGKLRGQGLALNQRAAQVLGNGFDWMFRRDKLVKSGRTWFELVHDGDPMAVRYYGLPEENDIELVDGSRMPIQREQHAVPLVLVPPLGVTTETFDLMPQRSLVRYMAARGFKTYLVDWGRPTREHAHLRLRDYADVMLGTALAKIRKHSGSQDVALMGWCMGGLLSLLYQGLNHDPHVRNIVTVASPIDMRGGGIVAGAAQALNGPAQLIRRYSNLRMDMLDPLKMQMPAWFTTLAFKLTDPVGSVTTYWDLVAGMSDRAFVESHSTTADYLNHMLMYPAGVIQDMLVKVAVDNKLASGRIELGDRLAELDRIRSSLLVFAGEKDILVPPPIAQKLVEIVASTDKEFHVAPGGHMGVILGSKAQSAVWAQSADWLAERSAA
ncbi:MAG TPA: alpha/beta fold hydrolase [Solimonas sp.]|nr:alpha/beta fold hydrolase [Solimonas sp.]